MPGKNVKGECQDKPTKINNMSEIESLEPRIDRENVVAALSNLKAKGYTKPDDLPLEDQDVVNAQALEYIWASQQQSLVKKLGTPAADLEFRLLRNTLYIDAGFDDSVYLEDVANGWLEEDLQEAEKKV